MCLFCFLLVVAYEVISIWLDLITHNHLMSCASCVIAYHLLLLCPCKKKGFTASLLLKPYVANPLSPSLVKIVPFYVVL